jgi:hypothetical protein
LNVSPSDKPVRPVVGKWLRWWGTVHAKV